MLNFHRKISLHIQATIFNGIQLYVMEDNVISYQLALSNHLFLKVLGICIVYAIPQSKLKFSITISESGIKGFD